MGACLYGGYRRKIYPLYSVAYITSSLSKEWERAFLWVSRKIFFYGINFDAAARFALWRWHQNWCHSTKTRFRLSFLVPKRSQSLAKSPPTPLPQPSSLQNDIYFRNFLKIFCSDLFAGKGSLCLLDLSIPLQQHGGQKNDILFLTFWKSFSTPVPQHQKQKSKHCIGTFFLYYLTATWDALKTTSNYSVFKKSLYSLTATSEAKKRHRFLKVFRKVTN